MRVLVDEPLGRAAEDMTAAVRGGGAEARLVPFPPERPLREPTADMLESSGAKASRRRERCPRGPRAWCGWNRPHAPHRGPPVAERRTSARAGAGGELPRGRDLHRASGRRCRRRSGCGSDDSVGPERGVADRARADPLRGWAGAVDRGWRGRRASPAARRGVGCRCRRDRRARHRPQSGAPAARSCALRRESAGTAHVAIGNNTGPYEGDNWASIHVDCVFSEPELSVDGRSVDLA